MNRDIAQQIATLLNMQNELTVFYDADKVLQAADRYIYRLGEDSKVVGAVEVKKVQWYQCEIDHLSVAVRRRGIGSSLLAEALARAEHLGARVAQCTIRVGNQDSESFFTKHGFTPTVTFLNCQNGNRVTIYQKAVDFHARAVAHDNDNKRYVRWQDYRITQFSFAINLFLSFAVAALVFYLTLIKDSGFNPPIGTGYLLRHSLFSLIGSIVFGSFATCSRLLDFRCTVIKIGKKYTDCRQSIAEFLAKQLGGISWALFYLQLAALAYGAFCLISALTTAYYYKIAR